MASPEIDALWQSAFPDAVRPEVYTNGGLDEDGFTPLSDPQIFFRDLSKLTQNQLYVTASNNQIAMKVAQDEYLSLERLIGQIKGKDMTKNPQQLPTPEVFEERKEAVLYGYKYEANKPALLQLGIPGNRSGDDVTDQEKRDVRLFQEPFDQGGFVPTKRQYDMMLTKATDARNVDGWRPVVKNGRKLVPRQQFHHDEYHPGAVRKIADDGGELLRFGLGGTDNLLTPPKVALNKIVTRTRYDGRRHPPTSREVSVAPSGTSTPVKRLNTPTTPERGDDTPSAKRRKVDIPNKPKHPNQYTKAREAREREAREREAKEQEAILQGGQMVAQLPIQAQLVPVMQSTEHRTHTLTAPYRDWTQLSPQNLRGRKWTDQELVEAVKQNHLWLHDDVNKAEDWKQKIINGTNPVRSFSMFKKWAYWKDENKDKRPRGKKEMGELDNTKKNGRLLRTISKKTDTTEEPSDGRMTPMSDMGIDYDDQMHNSFAPTPVNGRSRLGTEIPMENGDSSDAYLHPGMRPAMNGISSDTTTPATTSQFSNTPLFTSMLLKQEEPKGYFDVVYDHSSSQPENLRNMSEISSQNATASTTPSDGKRILRSARRGSA